LVSILALACSNTDSQAEVVHGSVAAESVAQQELSGRTGTGVVVRLVLEGDQFVEGPARLAFSVDSDVHTPRSVDLVAPQMPTHGVVRYPVERTGDAWIAAVDIPMAGEWIAYVNFDDGGDAAALRFTAVAQSGVAVHRHH
jgi:hypothetical protein